MSDLTPLVLDPAGARYILLQLSQAATILQNGLSKAYRRVAYVRYGSEPVFVTVCGFATFIACYAGLKGRDRPRLCKNSSQASAWRHSTFQIARYGVFSRSGMVQGPLNTRRLRVFTQLGPKHTLNTTPSRASPMASKLVDYFFRASMVAIRVSTEGRQVSCLLMSRTS
jgi:hypothetical protein